MKPLTAMLGAFLCVLGIRFAAVALLRYISVQLQRNNKQSEACIR